MQCVHHIRGPESLTCCFPSRDAVCLRCTAAVSVLFAFRRHIAVYVPSPPLFWNHTLAKCVAVQAGVLSGFCSLMTSITRFLAGFSTAVYQRCGVHFVRYIV